VEVVATDSRHVASQAVAVRLLRVMPWAFVVIWSTGFVVARLGMPHAPPATFLTLRFGLSWACFAAWIAIVRPAWPRSPSQCAHLCVVGMLIQAGYLGGVWSAVKAGMGAGMVSLLVGLQPVLTAVWSSVAAAPPGQARSRVDLRQWSGLFLGLAGLTLVVGRKLGGGELTAWNLGMALMALCSITAGTLYQKRFLAPCDVRTASMLQLTAAFLVMLPLGWLEVEQVVWHSDLVVALAWSVLGLTLGGSSLLYLLLQRGAATEVTSLMYLVPPCTAAMAWGWFGESFTPSMLLGMALTVAGVAMVVRRRPRDA
jgi:drug/metabolite transporter (DMT)-like permease